MKGALPKSAANIVCQIRLSKLT